MTLTEFLLARIAEDEALARGEVFAEMGATVEVRDQAAVTLGELGPTRVLAECEAKRAIMALHSAEHGQHPDFCGHDLRELPCQTLRLLALPHTDHPDYQQEWKL